MDRHVAKQTTRGLKIGAWRDRRIARGDDNLMQVPDLAVQHRLACRAVAGIEPAVKPKLDRNSGSGNLGGAGIDTA